MINKNLMDTLELLGFGADADALESYVYEMQDAAALGSPLVTDTIYDQHFRLLKEIKPDSQVLLRNWEAEDNELEEHDDVLKIYGMRSINTVQTMKDLYKFRDAIDGKISLFGSLKQNGHAVRAVYVYGNLKTGSTRGRYKKGRNITRHLKKLLPNRVEEWSDVPIMEVRGEAVVSYVNFEKLKHILKTPLSAVTSLIKESATDTEIDLLNVVCYKCINGDDISDNGFDTLEEEFLHLSKCGFKIPVYHKIDDVDFHNFEAKVEELLNYFEKLYDAKMIEFDTDGVVAAINDNKQFYAMGTEGNAWLGNFALKIGRIWESNLYSGVIEEIMFMSGKTYITPKARITPVITVTGSEVKTVPIYNVGLMEKLKLIPGNKIYFKFGGESGVTMVTAAGDSVSGL